MTVEKIACPLPSLLVDVVSLMRPRATEKGLTLSVAVDSPIPASITTDPLRVRQVLLNLLSNAVKFTERGSVTLHIACTRTDAGDTLAFKVVDTGIGMTEQQMQRLFQPFMQADKSTTRRFGGTGLGLAITRRLVQLLGGEIHVHSQPGVGTTFELTIDGGCTASPLVHEINATLDDGQATPCLHLMGDVLLAEDSPPLQSLIAAYLRKAGLHVEVADHGAQAVELATTRVFDVILMDMQMPVMDGYTAASTLRERGINTPIIALTANAMAEDRQRCLRAGCTDYLSKPIDRTKLLTCLAEHLEPLTEPRPIASTCRDPEMQQLITDYINDLPRYVAELSEAVQQRDLATLRRRLHTLKGTGGTFGLDPITHTAEQAESIVQPGAQLEAIQHAVDDMIEMLRSVEGYDRRKESVQGCVARSGGL
jgi:CheY-like chemotaxis protein/anti-sigma regulatory factor (Ser/Thr protein kinase)